jgi:hypothetical protein
MLFSSLFHRHGRHSAPNQEGQARRHNPAVRRAKPQTRYVPRLETLEDRTVPSYIFQNLLDDPSAGTGPRQGTQPNAINNSGEIVGFYIDASNVFHSYSQTGNVYTKIDPPNESTANPFSIATGINPQGQIVGVYSGTSGLGTGYLLSHGQYTSFEDPLEVHGTSTFGINASGQIVGEYLDANLTQRGFLLSQGTYTPIDDPLAGSGAFQGTIPFSINASGEIVGVYVDSAGINHGFLLSAGQYTTIDDPLGVGSMGGTQPSQINASGQIVGGYFDAAGIVHGYVQVGNQFTTVNDPAAAQGDFVNGINDSGQLVGGYFDATGLEHGFLATPVQGNSASARAASSFAGSGVPKSGFGANLILTNNLLAAVPPSTAAGGSAARASAGFSRTPTGESATVTVAPSTLTSIQAIGVRTDSVGSARLHAVGGVQDFGPFSFDPFNAGFGNNA